MVLNQGDFVVKINLENQRILLFFKATKNYEDIYMIISTFELLVKPQLPKDSVLSTIPGISPELRNKVKQLRRNAIQGYFLTLSNLSSSDLLLSLVFTTQNNTPLDKVVPILDTRGSDDKLGTLTPNTPLPSNKFSFSPLKLAANDTALFLLQPNFFNAPNLLVDTNFEVRGYVEVFLSSMSPRPLNAAIQVTPEHRGTFYNFPENDPNTLSQLDQYAYSLPVQNGGLLRFFPGLPGSAGGDGFPFP
jgi:hypothetical protein